MEAGGVAGRFGSESPEAPSSAVAIVRPMGSYQWKTAERRALTVPPLVVRPGWWMRPNGRFWEWGEAGLMERRKQERAILWLHSGGAWRKQERLQYVSPGGLIHADSPRTGRRAGIGFACAMRWGSGGKAVVGVGGMAREAGAWCFVDEGAQEVPSATNGSLTCPASQPTPTAGRTIPRRGGGGVGFSVR